MAVIPGKYRNLIFNPSVETSLANIGSEGAQPPVVSRSTDWAKSGNYSVKAVRNYGGSGTIRVGYYCLYPVEPVPYVIEATIMLDTVPGPGGYVYIEFYGKDASNNDAFIGSVAQPAVLGESVLRTTVTPNATVVNIHRLRVGYSGTTPGEVIFYTDAVMVMLAPAPSSYRDGDSPRWEWEGVPHVSPSRSQEVTTAAMGGAVRQINRYDGSQWVAIG